MNNRLTKELNKSKSIGSRTVKKSKMRWEDDVINDLQKIKVTNLKVADDVRVWKRIIKKVKKFKSEFMVP